MRYATKLFMGVALTQGLILNVYAACGAPTSAKELFYENPTPYKDYYAAWIQDNTLVFNISLVNYSDFINAALTGAPLPTEQGTDIAIPACFSISGTPNSFTRAKINEAQIGFRVLGPSWEGTSSKASTVNLPLNSNNSYVIGAKMEGYCPCGHYSGGTVCEQYFNPNDGASPSLELNTLILGEYYNTPNAESNAIGTCEPDSSSGALFFTIRAPEGILPAIGTYSAKITIGIGPAE